MSEPYLYMIITGIYSCMLKCGFGFIKANQTHLLTQLKQLFGRKKKSAEVSKYVFLYCKCII